MRDFGDSDRDIVLKTTESYSRMADKFAEATISFDKYPGLDAELRDFIRSAPPGVVLDIGCGSGRDAQFARSLGRRVVAGDISHEMLRRVGSRGSLNECLVCSDVTLLPFKREVFAAIIASGVLLHLPGGLCLTALKSMRRVLGVDGRAIISMKSGSGAGWRSTEEFPESRWFVYYPPTEFVGMCRVAGFSEIEMYTPDRKDWFVVEAR